MPQFARARARVNAQFAAGQIVIRYALMYIRPAESRRKKQSPPAPGRHRDSEDGTTRVGLSKIESANRFFI